MAWSSSAAAGRGARPVLVAVLMGVATATAAERARAEPPPVPSAAPPAPTEPDFQLHPPKFTLGLRGGWAFNRSRRGIYDFLTATHTLDRSDFDAPAFTVDLAYRALSWLDVVLGLEYSWSSTNSEYRDFVDDETGDAIEQKTRLTQVPLTLSLRFYPLPPGRQVSRYAWIRSRFVPYLGGGIGATFYRLKQSGEFVDATDQVIFEDVFESKGVGFAGHVFLGFDVKITRALGFVLEGRYYWSNPGLGGSYVGFGSIDLEGARIMAGISLAL